jgi:hypothetical protein
VCRSNLVLVLFRVPVCFFFVVVVGDGIVCAGVNYYEFCVSEIAAVAGMTELQGLRLEDGGRRAPGCSPSVRSFFCPRAPLSSSSPWSSEWTRASAHAKSVLTRGGAESDRCLVGSSPVFPRSGIFSVVVDRRFRCWHPWTERSCRAFVSVLESTSYYVRTGGAHPQFRAPSDSNASSVPFACFRPGLGSTSLGCCKEAPFSFGGVLVSYLAPVPPLRRHFTSDLSSVIVIDWLWLFDEGRLS